MKKTILSGFVLLVSSACADTGLLEPRREIERSQTPQFSTSSIQSGSIKTLDDELAELAAKVPGFGGMFKSEAGGRFIVHLAESSNTELATREIRAFLGGKGEILPLEFRQGTFDFRDLLSWRRQLERAFIDELVSGDVDEIINRVRIGLLTQSAVDQAVRELESLGIPKQAVVFEVQEYLIPENYSNYYRPVFGGLKVTISDPSVPARVCSLGYVALEHWLSTGVNTSGPRYVITSSHCTPFMGYNDYSTIGQPTLSSPIGTEFSDPPYFSSAQFPDCPTSSNECRFSDAAMFKLSSNSTSVSSFGTFGIHFWPGFWNWPYAGVQHSFWGNQPVGKVGHITGFTSGVVTQTCTTVSYPNTRPVQTDRLLCQYVGTYGSDPGDSGSPVFHSSGGFSSSNGAYITGIHVGRLPSDITKRVFSNWSHVSSEISRDVLATHGNFWWPVFY